MADADIKIKVQAEADTSALDEVQGKIDNLGDQSGQGLAGALDEAAESATNLSSKLDGAGQAGRQAGTGVVQGSAAGLQGIKSVGSGLDWLKAKWVMVAQAASGMFGAIGLVTQAWNFAKGIYDKLTEAERQRKEAAQQAAEEERKLAEKLLDDTNTSRRSAMTEQALSRQQEAASDVLTTYRDQTEELKRQLRLIREKADLEMGISDDKAQEDRLKVEEDYLAGRVTERQRDIALEKIDLDSNARRRDMRSQMAVQTVEAARTNRDNAATAWQDLLNVRDMFASDQVMTPQQYAESESRIGQGRSDITYLQNQWAEELEAAKKEIFGKGGKTPLQAAQQFEPIKKQIDARYDEMIRASEAEIAEENNRQYRSNAALSARGFAPGGGIENAKSASQAYANQLKKYDDQLVEHTSALKVAEENLVDAENAVDAVAAKNESEESLDRQQARTNDARRKKEDKDAEAVKTQERINQDLQESQSHLADTNKALAETKRNIQEQAGVIKGRAAGLADQQQGKARTAMVDKVLDMVSSGGGVDAAELDLLTNLRDRLSQQSGGDADGRQQIISMLSEIISSLASNQQAQKKAQAKIDALQRQLDRIKQQQNIK